MKSNFFIKIETMHYPDRGQQENIHDLPPEKLRQREVIHIDIANDSVPNKVRMEFCVIRSPVLYGLPLTTNFATNLFQLISSNKLSSLAVQDYKENEDPKKFRSEKTGRGPLLERNWRVSCAV